MVEYFTSILGRWNKYTGDIQEEYGLLAEQGLSDPNFDKMVAYLQIALSELKINDALASAVVAVFEGALEALLCKAEMEAKAATAAAAIATKNKTDEPGGVKNSVLSAI